MKVNANANSASGGAMQGTGGASGGLNIGFTAPTLNMGVTAPSTNIVVKTPTVTGTVGGTVGGNVGLSKLILFKLR